MKIFAIRHTSVKVEPGICYGQTDVGLAKSFPEEKEKVLEEISSVCFSVAFSSPLIRCKLLAESLFENKQIVYDARLKEMNFGEWELWDWDAIFEDREGRVWMENYQVNPTKNGESYPEMTKRVSAFLESLKGLERETIAIVTHAGVIRILKHLIEGVSIAELFENFKPAYGSVTQFEINKPLFLP